MLLLMAQCHQVFTYTVATLMFEMEFRWRKRLSNRFNLEYDVASIKCSVCNCFVHSSNLSVSDEQCVLLVRGTHRFKCVKCISSAVALKIDLKSIMPLSD